MNWLLIAPQYHFAMAILGLIVLGYVIAIYHAVKRIERAFAALLRTKEANGFRSFLNDWESNQAGTRVAANSAAD
jgi:hypothetical protein